MSDHVNSGIRRELLLDPPTLDLLELLEGLDFVGVPLRQAYPMLVAHYKENIGRGLPEFIGCICKMYGTN